MKYFFNNLLNVLKILLIIIFLVLLDFSFVEPNIFLELSQKVNVPNWNKDLNGFKVVLISDIHLGSKFVDIKKLNEVIKVTNKNNPDLIVICGDLDSKTIVNKNYSTTEVANSLKNFKSKYGVVAVMGEHDYEPENVVREIYKKSNIKLLEDNEYFININDKKIRIVGFKNLWQNQTIPKSILGNFSEKTPTIVLAHNPDYFAEIPKSVSLTLSGHTHGGEIILPIVGSYFVPSKYGNRYRNGYIIEDNKHLFVSRGLATLGYGRFLNPPEINILEIYAQTEVAQDTKPLKGLK